MRLIALPLAAAAGGRATSPAALLLAIKQDAAMLAFNRALPTYWRKGYRGNNSGDIAVQDMKSGQIVEITDTDLQQYKGHVNDVHPIGAPTA